MSSISFGKMAEKAAETPSPAPESPAATPAAADPVVVDRAETELMGGAPQNTAVSTNVHYEDGVVGEVSDRDIQFPRLRLIQGTSKFASGAPLGAITLGDDLLVLAKEGDPVHFVMASLRKQFQEKVPWGTERMPRMFDTLEEVRAAGGQIENSKGACYYDAIAHANMFVGIGATRRGHDPQADLIEALFLFDHGGMAWAPAVYTASGMSYAGFAKSIFTAQRFQLSKLWDGMFVMQSTEIPTNFGPKKKLNARLLHKFPEGEDKEFFAKLVTGHGD
jgi:hypothetical protein